MGSFKNSDDNHIPAYDGNDPYIFISYAHADSEQVYHDIERFHDDGYNMWYDEGISSGNRWQGAIENAILNAALFVTFISKNAVESENVQDELFLAKDNKIPIILIFLEESELKYGLGLSLNSYPSILKYQISERKYVLNYRELFQNYGFNLNDTDFNERIDNPPFEAYRGSEPYIFISYAHDDADLVFSDITRFHNDGYNIWYDEGISTGHKWQREIQNALENCSLFITFISRNAVESENVRDEIFLAKRKSKRIIPIFIESTELKYGLKLRLRSLQSIYRYQMSEEGYIERYRRDFKEMGFERREPESRNTIETEELIETIEEKFPDLNSDAQKRFNELIDLYVDADSDSVLEDVNRGLREILDDEYMGILESSSDILSYPSYRLNVKSDSVRSEIIKSAFLKLEELNLSDDLANQGHDCLDKDDIKCLEKTVVALYRQSLIVPEEEDEPVEENIEESSSDDVKLLIKLVDGCELTCWDDVEDRADVLYVTEDLTGISSLKTISARNVGDATNMKYMFSGCSSLEEVTFMKDWDVSGVEDMNAMFANCSCLKDLSGMEDWNVSSVVDMNGMFDGCASLSDISALKGWNTSKVVDLSGMFYNCASLVDTFALKNWNIENVKFMKRMFRGCTSLIDVSALKNWDTSNVGDMNSMFKGCSDLTDIFSLKNWNMKNVDDITGLFNGCSALADISSLKGWKTSKVSDMSELFAGCSSLVDVSALKDWKTGSVTDMREMFKDCTSLTDIFPLKNWDIKKLKDTSRMFYNCSSLEDVSALKGWDGHNIIFMDEMFGGATEIEEEPEWYEK